MILQQGMGTPPDNSTRATAASDVHMPIASSLLTAMQTQGDASARAAAAEQMRQQLYMLDRSQRRPSIEDVASDLLEHSNFEPEA